MELPPNPNNNPHLRAELLRGKTAADVRFESGETKRARTIQSDAQPDGTGPGPKAYEALQQWKSVEGMQYFRPKPVQGADMYASDPLTRPQYWGEVRRVGLSGRQRVLSGGFETMAVEDYDSREEVLSDFVLGPPRAAGGTIDNARLFRTGSDVGGGCRMQ